MRAELKSLRVVGSAIFLLLGCVRTLHMLNVPQRRNICSLGTKIIKTSFCRNI